jgi:hypothetical protein
MQVKLGSDVDNFKYCVKHVLCYKHAMVQIFVLLSDLNREQIFIGNRSYVKE